MGSIADAMLPRLLFRSPALRLLPSLHRHHPPPAAAAATFRPFSAGGDGGGDNGEGKGGKFESWRFSADHPDHGFFGSDGGDLSGISDEPSEDAAPAAEEKSKGDVFGHIDEEFASAGGGADDDWLRGDAEQYKLWRFDGDREEVEKVFDVGDAVPGSVEDFKDDLSVEREEEKRVVDAALEKEEKELRMVLKGVILM